MCGKRPPPPFRTYTRGAGSYPGRAGARGACAGSTIFVEGRRARPEAAAAAALLRAGRGGAAAAGPPAREGPAAAMSAAGSRARAAAAAPGEGAAGRGPAGPPPLGAAAGAGAGGVSAKKAPFPEFGGPAALSGVGAVGVFSEGRGCVGNYIRTYEIGVLMTLETADLITLYF